MDIAYVPIMLAFAVGMAIGLVAAFALVVAKRKDSDES